MNSLVEIVTILGTGAGVIWSVYQFFRNFKQDIKEQIDKMEKRIDAVDERMFYLSTGRSLQDAILAEKMKAQVAQEKK